MGGGVGASRSRSRSKNVGRRPNLHRFLSDGFDSKRGAMDSIQRNIPIAPFEAMLTALGEGEKSVGKGRQARGRAKTGQHSSKMESEKETDSKSLRSFFSQEKEGRSRSLSFLALFKDTHTVAARAPSSARFRESTLVRRRRGEGKKEEKEKKSIGSFSLPPFFFLRIHPSLALHPRCLPHIPVATAPEEEV